MDEIAKYASFIPLALMGLGVGYLVVDWAVKDWRQSRASKRAEKPGGLEATVHGSSRREPALKEAHYKISNTNSNLYK